MTKYQQFSDDEIYILSRQAIESSFEITMTGKYDDAEISTHIKILNELISERKLRRQSND